MPGLDDPAARAAGAAPARSGGGGATEPPIQAAGAESHGPIHTAPIESDGPAPAGKAKVVAKDDDPFIGRTIAGRYRVEARLGEGGMGAVYRVEHTHMRKKLAVKVLHREMTSQTEIVARFEREAMAAAHIEHPNVAGATDFGKLEDGSFYLVLEYVEGTSLRQVIDGGHLAAGRAVHITIQILAALKRAHELGIVHRDLKPENVLLVEKDGDPDFVKVLDFGIARVPIGSLSGNGEAGPSLTRAGMVYGTPEYMAPEQALGQAVDGRSDLYGVGVMLFEMLTGRRPYDNKDKVALLGQHVAGAIPSVRERAPTLMLSVEVDAVVSRLMQKSPSDRYADAMAAIEALQSTGLDSMLLPLSRNPSNFRSSGQSGGYPAAQVRSGPLPIVLNTGGPEEAPARISVDAVPRIPTPVEYPRKSKIPAVLGALGVAGLVVMIVVLLIGRNQRGQTGAGSSAGSGSGSTMTNGSDSTAPTPSIEALQEKAAQALARAQAGDPQGLADLEQLSGEAPSDPVLLLDLAKGYSASKRQVEALGALKRLVTASPSSASDPAIDPIIDAALPTAADTAFGLLQGAMGTQGTPILYDIAYGVRGPANLRPRARAALAEPEVQKNLTPAVRGALELMKAGTCDQKKASIETYRADLDKRGLAVLRPLTSMRGCGGFFKDKDCWPCLHKDKYLDTVIKEIETRTKK